MSNYAYLITKKNKSLPIGFLEKFDPLNITIVHHNQWVIYFFSNAVQSCQYNLGYFKGYYIDHGKEKVGFSQFRDMNKSYLEGCFINIEQHLDKGVVILNNDVFGLMPLLYSFEKDAVIVSDSLYFIKKLRDGLGYKSTLDDHNFIARTYINAITSHSMSSSTIFNEIKYALPGSVLDINIKAEMLVKVSHEGARNIFRLQDLSYEEIIKKAAHQLCGSLGGIVNSGILPCNFDLTGGLDSRLVLAAVTPFFGTDKLTVGSSTKHQDDFTIAKKICDSFNITLNEKYNSENIKIHPGAMWLASNAGFTDTLYASNFQRKDGFRFNIGGHGAEIYKGNYGWRKVSDIGKNYENKEIYNYLQRELEQGLLEFGIDPDDEIGSEWHYLAFRNAIHGSRGTQVSNFYLRPLMMKFMVHNIKIEKKTNKYKANPISDMLTFINPELAKMDFDDKRKNITQDNIEQIYKSMGKYDFDLPFYKVESCVNVSSNGYMLEVLEMAVEDGFKDKIDYDNFGFYINNKNIPKNNLTKYIIRYLFDYIYSDKKIKKSQRDMAISKLLSLSLID